MKPRQLACQKILEIEMRDKTAEAMVSSWFCMPPVRNLPHPIPTIVRREADCDLATCAAVGVAKEAVPWGTRGNWVCVRPPPTEGRSMRWWALEVLCELRSILPEARVVGPLLMAWGAWGGPPT